MLVVVLEPLSDILTIQPSPFSYINASVYVDKDINLNTTVTGEHNTYVVVQEPRIVVATGSSITVGLGKTLVTDLYQLGDL